MAQQGEGGAPAESEPRGVRDQWREGCVQGGAAFELLSAAEGPGTSLPSARLVFAFAGLVPFDLGATPVTSQYPSPQPWPLKRVGVGQEPHVARGYREHRRPKSSESRSAWRPGRRARQRVLARWHRVPWCQDSRLALFHSSGWEAAGNHTRTSRCFCRVYPPSAAPCIITCVINEFMAVTGRKHIM